VEMVSGSCMVISLWIPLGNADLSMNRAHRARPPGNMVYNGFVAADF